MSVLKLVISGGKLSHTSAKQRVICFNEVKMYTQANKNLSFYSYIRYRSESYNSLIVEVLTKDTSRLR